MKGSKKIFWPGTYEGFFEFWTHFFSGRSFLNIVMLFWGARPLRDLSKSGLITKNGSELRSDQTTK